MNIVIDAGVIAKAFDWKKSTLSRLIRDIPENFERINSKRSQIFISYARKDKEKVNDIYRQLKEWELNLWRDRENIPPGADWAIDIEKAIDQSAFFLACLSSNALPLEKRGFLKKEIVWALHSRRVGNLEVIPVSLEKLKKDSIPEGLKRIELVKWYKNDGRAKLLRWIKDKIEGQELYKVCFDGSSDSDSEILKEYEDNANNWQALKKWYREIHHMQVFHYCGKIQPQPEVESHHTYIGVALTSRGVLVVEDAFIEKLRDLAPKLKLQIWDASQLDEHLSTEFIANKE